MLSLQYTVLELSSILDGYMDWETIRGILGYGLQMFLVFLKEALVVRPYVGFFTFLGSLGNLSRPKTIMEVRKRASENYRRFSWNYLNVFWLLVPVCVVVSSHWSRMLRAGALLLLCGFLQLRERNVAGRRVSVEVQKVGILSVLLSVSGFEALFLRSLLKMGCLVLLHAVFHDPALEGELGVGAAQLENEHREGLLTLPNLTFDRKVIWEILSFGYESCIVVVEVLRRSLVFGPPVALHTDLGSSLWNTSSSLRNTSSSLRNLSSLRNISSSLRNRFVNNCLQYSDKYFHVFCLLVPIFMMWSAHSSRMLLSLLRAGVLLLLCGFLQLREGSVAGRRVSVEAQKAVILHALLSVSGLDGLFLTSLLKVGCMVLLHAVIQAPPFDTPLGVRLWDLLKII